MPTGLNIRVRAKLTEGYSNIIKEYSKNYATGKKRLGKDIQDTARGYAPVDTGALRRSISVVTKEFSDFAGNVASAKGLRPTAADYVHGKPSVTSHDVIVVAPMHYAIYQEFGTRSHGSQPYLIPAFDEVTSNFSEHFSALLKIGRMTKHSW